MTKTEFAQHMKVDKSRVSQWGKAGRLVMVDGKVDAPASEILIARTGTRARYLSTKVAKVPRNTLAARAVDVDQLRAARIRTETTRADLAELEARVRAGELVDASVMRDVLATIVKVAVTALDGLPARLATTLAGRFGGAAGEIRLVLKADIDAARRAVFAEFERTLPSPASAK